MDTNLYKKEHKVTESIDPNNVQRFEFSSLSFSDVI